jgi:hypothetical protein
LYLIPFSLLWGGFAIVWETVAVTHGGPWFMCLWGLPFVLLGLYLIIGRFLWDAYARSRTSYAITHDSAIIRRDYPHGGLQTMYLPMVAGITLTTASDGSGTILFGPDDRRIGGWRSWTSPSNAFQYIRDARKVYDLCARSQSAGVVDR